MPPKRGGRRGATSNDPPAEPPLPAPPSSEDAKPNVDQLNAASSEGAELPLDPIAPPPQPDPVSVNTTPAPSARSTPSVQLVDTPDRPTPTPSSAAARGKRPVAAPRGTGRRSQAQREALQKAEDERRKLEAQQRAQEDAAKAKQQGKWHGGRGRGRGDFRGGRGKGRGGYVGDFERRNKESLASGPFSSGDRMKDKRGSTSWRPSGGISRGKQVGLHAERRQSGAGVADGVTGESGTFTTGMAPAKRSTRPSYGVSGSASRARTADDGTPVKPDPDSKPALDADGDIAMSRPIDGGFISSDEEAEEKEKERFNIEDLIDLTKDDDDYDRPVRVMRVAHKERTMGINADGATNKEGAIAVGANDEATTSKRKGKQKARDAPQTFELSSGSDKEAEHDTQPSIKPDPDAPSAAEERLQEPQLAGSALNSDDLPQEPPSSPESKRKGKAKIKSRTMSSSSQPDRPDLQTQEEIDEWDRNQADLRTLRYELGSPAPIASTDGATEEEDLRKDKVYLFQFPPVLPDLAPLALKPDPEAPPSANAMDVDGATNSKDNPLDVSSAEPSSNQPKIPSGLVGKLNVHKSGRATLDWGGTSFCLSMGVSASFLQDVFVMGVPEVDEAGARVGEGEAMALSMGQVKGKFVVTPDWEEILG